MLLEWNAKKIAQNSTIFKFLISNKLVEIVWKAPVPSLYIAKFQKQIQTRKLEFGQNGETRRFVHLVVWEILSSKQDSVYQSLKNHRKWLSI